MSPNKLFTLAQILSITTGRLCCKIEDVYEILNHVTGDDLFTHVLPRAAKFASPLILAMYPELEKAGSAKNLVRLSELLENIEKRKEPAMNAITMWLEWMQEPAECGLKSSYELPCWKEQWESKNPLQEAVETFGKKNVITIGI